MTIFSPRASTMAHDVGDERVSLAWSRRCNDLIERVVDLFPETFVGVDAADPVRLQEPGDGLLMHLGGLRGCRHQRPEIEEPRRGS